MPRVHSEESLKSDIARFGFCGSGAVGVGRLWPVFILLYVMFVSSQTPCNITHKQVLKSSGTGIAN